MSNQRPTYATEMLEPDRAHAEVIDPTTRKVWQTLAGCSREELDALELPEPYRPLGVGFGAMDEHWFDRSPGAEKENGPMEEQGIAGLRFAHCACPASPPKRPFGDDGPTEMLVDKHHALRFAAGRRVAVLHSPEGESFVHVIDGQGQADVGLMNNGGGDFVVPPGWALGFVTLEVDWVLRLPHPARVFFFASGDSYQGPIEAPPGAWETEA